MHDEKADRRAELERYREYLRALAEANLSPRLTSKLDPSDVVQATLLRACQGINGLKARSPSEVATWLRRILTRNMRSTYRELHSQKRDVRKECSLDEVLERSSPGIGSLVSTREVAPCQKAERRELLTQLSGALTRLPDAQREALMLHHWQGWPLEAVGRQMGRTRDAVAGLVKRGIRSLREELKGP